MTLYKYLRARNVEISAYQHTHSKQKELRRLSTQNNAKNIRQYLI